MGLHEIGQTVLGDVPLHKCLTQMKFLGLRMYHLAFATESLFAVLGDPKTFRQGLGSVQKQDPKIGEWPPSAGDEAGRMVNFLRASLKRADETDQKRSSRQHKRTPRDFDDDLTTKQLCTRTTSITIKGP